MIYIKQLRLIRKYWLNYKPTTQENKATKAYMLKTLNDSILEASENLEPLELDNYYEEIDSFNMELE